MIIFAKYFLFLFSFTFPPNEKKKNQSLGPLNAQAQLFMEIRRPREFENYRLVCPHLVWNNNANVILYKNELTEEWSNVFIYRKEIALRIPAF